MNLPIRESLDILERATERFDPSCVFCAFSGGHDSLVATHFAMRYGSADAVVHINTGIGIPRTRTFVRDVCDEYGWQLAEYHARYNTRSDGTPDPQRYEELVAERGFPGPPMHFLFYTRLKERQLRRLARDFRDDDQTPLLVSGRRQHESGRRMRGMDEPIEASDELWDWVQPLFSWTDENVRDYRQAHNLPSNPVVEKLHMSGECLCGAFAHEGELAEIGTVDREVYEWICDLEERLPFPWGWEERPPDWWDEVCRGQQQLPGAEADEYTPEMCHGCVHAADDEVSDDITDALDVSVVD